MGLNNINSKSTWGQAASDINTNFTTIDSDLKKVKNATTRNKGYFSTSSELISAFPTASKGDIAYVGSSYPYDIWKWNGGSWAKSGSTGGEESVNLGNYYTKVETDEKFTEADAKLSELSEEISGLRTETDQKLSETSEEISGLRTETDQKLSELGSKLNGLTETIINIDVVKGVSINTTQIAAGATPVHFYKKSYLDLHLSDDDVLDNVGIVTVYLLLTDGNAVTVPIPKNTTTRTYIPEDCNYIGFYKSGTQILGNGTLTFSVTNANVDELFDKTNDLEKDALITKQNIDSLIEKSYSIGENIAVYKELKGYTSVDGILKNTSASSSFNSNVYDISNYSHIGVCYALGTNSSTFAVLLSNDENFVNGNKVINLKDGKSSFIFSTEGYKYVAFGVGKTNADYYITKVEYNDLLEDSFAQKDYSFVLGENINTTTYDSSQKVNLKKGVEHIIKFLINSSWELHELTHITLSLFSEKGLYLKEIVKVDTEFRFIPTEDIIGVGLYFNSVFALGNGVLQLFIGRKGLDNKYTYLVEELNKKAVNLYGGKTCLYIGDSISTLDNYKWKGFLETNYNVSFVRDKPGELAPANGGVTIMPAITESEDLAAKSIWYRCANNRMSIYDFDVISLFGGTNDMTNENLIIGTVDDTAYVDNVNGFSSDDNVTDVRPDNLSLASALRGCILMLKRDFPNKEIIIPTVMPCGGQYGNWTDQSSGLRASEAIAELQMKMAEKYELKAIPLYWSMNYPNMDNNRIWVKDGVHPNMQGALNIQRMFAQILCL